MSVAQSDIDNPKPREVRGVPYNEILIDYRYFGQIRAGVYNDIGEKYISEQDFADIDTEKIKKESGAIEVIKNGPRFWVMDEITGYYNGEEKVIAGYKMNQPGILNFSFSDLKNRAAYSIHKINRKTTYTYKKGEKVYELISDKNAVYTMQSASREIDGSLSGRRANMHRIKRKYFIIFLFFYYDSFDSRYDATDIYVWQNSAGSC